MTERSGAQILSTVPRFTAMVGDRELLGMPYEPAVALAREWLDRL